MQFCCVLCPPPPPLSLIKGILIPSSSLVCLFRHGLDYWWVCLSPLSRAYFGQNPIYQRSFNDLPPLNTPLLSLQKREWTHKIGLDDLTKETCKSGMVKSLL